MGLQWVIKVALRWGYACGVGGGAGRQHGKGSICMIMHAWLYMCYVSIGLQRPGKLTSVSQSMSCPTPAMYEPSSRSYSSDCRSFMLQAIAWLEEELARGAISLILVTHDRWFMEAVCTRLVELEGGHAHAHAFGGHGSYERYRQVSKNGAAAPLFAAAVGMCVCRNMRCFGPTSLICDEGSCWAYDEALRKAACAVGF